MLKKILVIISFIYAPALVAQVGSQTANNFVFIENKGQVANDNQTNNSINFVTQQNGVKMFLGKTKIHYVWNKYSYTVANTPIKETYRLDIELLAANPNPIIEKINPSKEIVNYYKGFNQGISNIHQYSKLIYKNIYNGIDWVWYENEGVIKYDFIIHPGANYKQIKIKVSGASGKTIEENGGLRITTPFGELYEAPPVSFCKGKQIATQFDIENDIISFSVANYPKNETLTIDPVIIWSTYYGGSNFESGKTVTESNNGDIFLAGLTDSDNNIFFNGHQNKTTGFAQGAFLVKFNNQGDRIWATYFGGYDINGNGQSVANKIAVDDLGNIYIVGTTNVRDSISTVNAHQPKIGGGNDAFLAKFSSSGILLWSTYFGGLGNDEGISIKWGLNGGYIAGNTNSTSGIANTTNSALTKNKGKTDVFIARFDSSGKRSWSGYFGGEEDDYLGDITISSRGNLYLAGTTKSTTGIYKNGHKSFLSGVTDAFLVKFRFGDDIDWATYYGGTDYEEGTGVEVDSLGNAYLYGKTQSTTFIASSGAHKTTLSGNSDAFLAKFSVQGVRQWATYEGGEADEETFAIAINPANDDLFITGRTKSITGIFFNGLKQKTVNDWDLFIEKFDKNGAKKWGTYYNSQSTTDIPYDLFIGKKNTLYIAGTAGQGTYFGFSGHQNNFGGNQDAFLSVISDDNFKPNIPLYKGEYCGAPFLEYSTIKPYKNVETRWFKAQTDTVPFYIGDTLSRQVFATDTLWLNYNYINYTSEKVSVITKVNPTTTVSFTINDTIFCKIRNKIIVSNTSKDTLSTYIWDFGDGVLSSLPTDTHSYINFGNFIVTLRATSPNKCVSNKSVVITILESPLRQNITGPTTSFNGKVEVYFAKHVPTSKYKWVVDGGTILSGDSSSSITVLWGLTEKEGKVSVVEINYLGCDDVGFSKDVSLQPSGISDFETTTITAYPNPTSKWLTLKANTKTDYIFLDVLGRTLLQGTVDETSVQQLDLSLLPKGAYILQYTNKNFERKNIKIVLQ